MEAKATYHLPPNYSTPPPPKGPFHLGTVLRDFDKKEQMRPLNHGEGQRVIILEKYTDQKGGFTATRKKLKSGELGLWAKFMALEGVGGEACMSAERSDSDRYEFDSVETEYFYPSPKYISDCLKLTDVNDYIKGSRYRKAVYLVTGVKVGMGVTVRMEKKTNVKGKFDVRMSNPGGADIQVGPKAEGKLEDEHIYVFTASSNIVVGIQCLRIYHEKSGLFGLFGKTEMKSDYVTSGAAFYGESDEAPEEKPPNFIAVNPDQYGKPELVRCFDGDETWMLPKELEAQMS